MRRIVWLLLSASVVLSVEAHAQIGKKCRNHLLPGVTSGALEKRGLTDIANALHDGMEDALVGIGVARTLIITKCALPAGDGIASRRYTVTPLRSPSQGPEELPYVEYVLYVNLRFVAHYASRLRLDEFRDMARRETCAARAEWFEQVKDAERGRDVCMLEIARRRGDNDAVGWFTFLLKE